MNQSIKEYLAGIGKKGGSSGKGEKKKRGDSDYYKKIRSLRNQKGKAN